MKSKLTPTRILLLIGFVALLCWATHLLSQEPSPPPKADEPLKVEYKPDEVQALQLQVLQRDAVISKKDLDFAQSNYQRAITQLNQKFLEIKKANKWPDAVQLNPNSLAICGYGVAPDQISCAPKPPDKPGEKKDDRVPPVKPAEKGPKS